MIIEKRTWKVGELAKLTGITVRTLHHYDDFGLLSPSRHSDAGHRLYAETDIARLQQIMSLKQLGFGLDEIKALIENPSYDPRDVIRMQLERLSEQIRIQEDLRSRLNALYTLLSTQREVKAEQFIHVIEVMKMSQNYFTPEQMDKIKKQGEWLGPEKIKEVESEWPVLIAKVRQELDKGTPPDHPEVIKLARRWKELMELFTGGDPEITRTAERFHAENPGNGIQNGVDKQLYEYIKAAMSAANADASGSAHRAVADK